MIYKNEKFNIGDWIEVTIYDSMMCTGVITKVNDEEMKLYIKQVISFCYPGQRLLNREIKIKYSEICEITNLTVKVKNIIKKHGINKSHVDLLKKSKGNYFRIERYLNI